RPRTLVSSCVLPTQVYASSMATGAACASVVPAGGVLEKWTAVASVPPLVIVVEYRITSPGSALVSRSASDESDAVVDAVSAGGGGKAVRPKAGATARPIETMARAAIDRAVAQTDVPGSAISASAQRKRTVH